MKNLILNIILKVILIFTFFISSHYAYKNISQLKDNIFLLGAVVGLIIFILFIVVDHYFNPSESEYKNYSLDDLEKEWIESNKSYDQHFLDSLRKNSYYNIEEKQEKIYALENEIIYRLKSEYRKINKEDFISFLKVMIHVIVVFGLLIAGAVYQVNKVETRIENSLKENFKESIYIDRINSNLYKIVYPNDSIIKVRFNNKGKYTLEN